MPTQTFPCPFCAKKMGVGIELLGKKVRCPHCNQILVAPAPQAVPVPPPPVVPVAVAPPPPPPPPEPELPTFNLPTQEGRESIFGDTEEESDDVFGSSEQKLRVPEMPPPPPPPVELPPADVMPLEKDEVHESPTEEINNPFSDLKVEAPPAAVAPPPPPPPPVQPVVVQPVVVQPVAAAPAPPVQAVPVVAPIGATPPSSAGGNPWAGMDQPPAVPTVVPMVVPAPAPVPIPVPAEEDSPFTTETTKPKKRRDDEPGDDRPARRNRAATPAAGGNPIFKIGFFILAPYALIATIAAIYGLFLKSSVPAGHPLSNLPDNFGEFSPAERKKTGRLNFPLDGELPESQKVALGEKLPIGQLEITPVSVEERKLRIFTEAKSGTKGNPETTSATAIVLKMNIKNTSDDTLIHPMDPAFNRRITGSEKIGTVLMVGKVSYPGGAIAWPFPDRVSRRYEEAQSKDADALKPGESREYVVFTDASQRTVKAAKDARDSLLWRVHVRRGRMDFDGKDIPVTAIIGVEFKPSDIKNVD